MTNAAPVDKYDDVPPRPRGRTASPPVELYALIDDGGQRRGDHSTSFPCSMTTTTTSSSSSSYDRHAELYPSDDRLERTRRPRGGEGEGDGSEGGRRGGGGGGGGGPGWFRGLFRWRGGVGVGGVVSSTQPSSSVARSCPGGGEDDHDENAGAAAGDPAPPAPSFDARVVPIAATSSHRLLLASARRTLSVVGAGEMTTSTTTTTTTTTMVMPARALVSSSRPSSRANDYDFDDDLRYCIVGPGLIAEFRPPYHDDENDDDDDDDDRGGAVHVVGSTSDRRRLSTTTTTTTTPRDVRRARATCVGRGRLAISWGGIDDDHDDGRVVFYRRRKRKRREVGGRMTPPSSSSASSSSSSDDVVVWEAIAVASPSGSVVRAALGDVAPATRRRDGGVGGGGIREDDDRDDCRDHRGGREGVGDGGNGLLLRDAGTLVVTDLLSVSTNNGKDVALAISRLGGFVELLPLPRWVWRPNERDDVDVDDDRSLPDLTDACAITAFTTAQLHFDVMSLDAYVCLVDSSHRPAAVGGDPTASTSPSPAEFILATCGGGGRLRPAAAAQRRSHRRQFDDNDEDDCAEVVTLWAVSTARRRRLSSSLPRDGDNDMDVSLGGEAVGECDDRDRDAPLELIVRRLDHLTIDNVGADASVFLSDFAAERWTRALTEDDGHDDRERTSSTTTTTGSRKRKGRDEGRTIPSPSVAVVTVAAPVVMLRFTPPSGNSCGTDSGVEDKVLLAALDYNGGVTVLDCTASIRMATVTEKNDDKSDPPYVHDGNSKRIRLFCSRDLTMAMPSGGRGKNKSSSKGGIMMASASQIEWWSLGGGGGDGTIGRHEHPNAGSAVVGEVSHSCSFTLVTYATLLAGHKENKNCFLSEVKSGRTKAIVRMQRWSWSSGIAKGHDQHIPSDVFCMPIFSSGGNASSIALLPMVEVPRQRQQNGHPSLCYHEMMPFLRLSADIVPTVADNNTSNTTNNNPASSSAPTPPSQCRLHLSICGIKKFSDPAEIIAALLRRGDASKAIGVARRFGIDDEAGQRQNYDLGEEGRLMMNQCRIQLWEDRRDVHALTLISDDAYVIGQALELLQCRDCCGRISGDRGVRAGIIVNNEGLSLADLSKTFREALARCDALGGEESASNARRLRDAVRRIGTFKLLLNHYVDKTTASNADAATGFSSNEQFIFERRFLKDFTHESLYGFAACAASKGDIDALTVLIVRHPLTTSERMQLLDLIPFEVEIALYEHLLPCYINEDIHGGRKDSHSFLPRRRSHLLDNEMFLSPLLLFTHLSDLQLQRRISGANNSEGIPAIDIFTDDADRDHVMLHFEEGSNDDPLSLRTSSSSTKADVATWYLKRAVSMHNQSGQVLPVKELCAAGLARLGFVTFTTESRAVKISDFNNISVSSTESQAVGKLMYLYSAASFFCRILADKLTSILRTVYVDEGQEFQESLSNESFGNSGGGLFLSVVQFCSMDLKATIPYILENSNISMFQKYFAHTINGGECLELRNNGATVSYAASENMSGRLEYDMMELCLNKIKRLRTSKNANSSTLQPSLSLKLEESLSLCAAFALFWGGAHPKSRIAQNEDCLIEFLERIFNSALDVMEGDWDVLTEGVISKLWLIFEVLPYTTPRESDGQHSASTIYKEAIGGLHFRLVALQLCCKWHERQRFPSELWNLLHTTSDKEEDKYDDQSTRDMCLAGRGVISIMCGGFCERASKMTNPNSGALAFKDRGLLFDFISDIDEFDGRFFSAGAQQSGCIGMFLFSPLLYQHCFVMLKNILQIQPSWFCQNFTCSIVASFIRDAATSKNKDANVMSAYQEILGQVFPHLCAEFDHQQRMIAAKEFMAIVMKLDDVLLGKLFSIIDYSAKPIDLMRALIEMDAPAILLGCEFWGDKMSAHAACTDASLYFSSQIRGLLSRQPAVQSSYVLPPMPGARVIQLANLIGLYASRDILLVKHLMVNGALRMNLGPAAVAICYSMLCDIAASRRQNNADYIWANRHEFQVIDCIAAIAKARSFLDLPIKRDLCTIALQLFSMADSPLYCVLLDVFKDLEYEILALEMSSLDDDSDQLSGRTNDFLVFKTAELVASLVDNLNKNSDIPMKRNNFYDQSMSRVFREINKSSQADLLKKLCRIGRQAVDDDNTSLAVSISEAIFQWVVAETFLARKSLIPLSLPIAKIFMMTELGLSCLLEFQGQEKSLNMKRTFQDIKAKSRLPIAQNIAFPESTAQPDMSIIQRLCDRGYGQNAARRAVIMTDNQGYSAALTWAVSHFSDADFDSPLFFLRSDTSHVDQCLVDMVDKLLQSVQNRVKVKWSQTDTSKHDLTSEAATKRSKALDKSYGSSILPKKSISSKIPCQSPFASPLSSSERDQDVDYSSSSNSATASGVTELAHATALTKTTFVSNLPSPSMTKACLPHKSANTYSTKMAVNETPMMISAARPPPRNSPDSASSVEGSLSSRASIKNQIKLGRARFETQKLSLDERKKLALEGKRLLSAARAQRKNVLAPPTTITTSNPPPAFEG